jgi:hypothetical protein
MDVIILLKQKGFREIEPCYYTLCADFDNYFIYINPYKPLFVLYTIYENKPKILEKETIVEFFYQDINRMFFDHPDGYYQPECYEKRVMDMVLNKEKLPNYHINESEI